MGNPQLGMTSSNKLLKSPSSSILTPSGSGTTAGGTNYVGYLTTAENSSLVLSYNLAVGGATIDNDLVSSYADDLVSQVGVFEEQYGDKPDLAPWTAESAVFSFWIGINEYVYLSLPSN